MTYYSIIIVYFNTTKESLTQTLRLRSMIETVLIEKNHKRLYFQDPI